MESKRQPYISDDGDHVFPVTVIRRLPGEAHENSSGEIRWNHRSGISFRFEFPAKTLSEVFTPPPVSTVGAGAILPKPSTPEWSAVLANGTEILLYGVNERQISQVTSGSGGRTILGRALCAKVTLTCDDQLSFWRDTEVTDRLYFVGLEMFPWPQDEIVEWKKGERSGWFSRASMSLSPTLRLVRASNSPPEEKAVWLTYTADGTASELSFDEGCNDVRRFVSFLVGQATPFLWKDRFIDEKCITRLYMTGHRRLRSITGTEQPFPLGRTTSMFKYGHDIIRQLPAMFAKFVELRSSYDVEWIASPIWYAYNSYIDDKLALACVSLERLATAHAAHQKKNDLSSRAKPFLDPQAYDALRDAMTVALKSVASVHNFSSDVEMIISRKIDSMNQRPNQDKLSAVFGDLGIVLTHTEAH